ncbi:electroneutral sodium bicarbonate exchanger 1-like [Diabrotica virgifera virgifera]|uniref:Anion exchange protein n=1 Tax=Diabrotica virgifera virgifera TaxID=50390 RepID=A0ABM5JHD6_DIAVI|nr:electroneutral sodium bicarbonate exchanger 1-like [Diabrotica virgifera virgifera]
MSVRRNMLCTTPSEKVQSLLDQEENTQNGQFRLFSEIQELNIERGEMIWRETARYIKFEELVEDGGSRWSKPHVASFLLHSAFELRRLLLSGIVMFDMPVLSLYRVIDLVLVDLGENYNLSVDEKFKVKKVLLARHQHQHQRDRERRKKAFIKVNPFSSSQTSTSSLEDIPDAKQNLKFMKKIPEGTEASNILVGGVESLEKTIVAFVRLSEAVMLDELTEVPVKSRFIFILLGPLGPKSAENGFHEIGRAMAALMSDEVFCEVAYHARDKSHIIAGIDEFLNAIIAIPPSEWDPAVRIEPPASVPSQDRRKRPPEKFIIAVDGDTEEQRLREYSGLVRTGVLFGGLVNDVKRKVPFYVSDFKDAFALQTIASWIFLYFACLSPIITFGGLLSEATGKSMAAIESLLSGLICGVIYGFFSGQPLSILGSTGPVLIFETIIYDFCEAMTWDYLSFRFWIGTWTSIILLTLVSIDASAFVSYITRFTDENFAILVTLIYIYKAFENVWAIKSKFPINLDINSMNITNCTSTGKNKTISQFLIMTNSSITDNATMQFLNGSSTEGCLEPPHHPGIFFMSLFLFLGTFFISIQLKYFKNARFFSSRVRQYLSDFSITIAICSMALLDFYVGIPTPKLEIPHELKPTLPDRGWIIFPFNGNPLYTVFVAIFPALLGTILIFMDQQITAVIVNRKEHNFRKGCGYHLDLFVLAILIQICSIMGLPWFVAATVLSITHVNSLKRETECTAPGDKPQFLGVREQRVTHILIFLSIGLSIFLSPVLEHLPMPVLYGVFLYMGVTSLKGLQFFDRICLLFTPMKYQPDYIYLRQVPIRKVHIFTIIQLTCLIGMWLIKSFRQTSIFFPLMLVVMIAIRKSLDFVFTKKELRALDDLWPQNNQIQRIEESRCWMSKYILGPKLIPRREHLDTIEV